MTQRRINQLALAVLAPFCLRVLISGGQTQKSNGGLSPSIPRTWDDEALADSATPVAGHNIRPTHISAKDYYALPVENLRTYPVYYPGREPEGYWEMLQHVGPKPLIEPEKLKSEADCTDT